MSSHTGFFYTIFCPSHKLQNDRFGIYGGILLTPYLKAKIDSIKGELRAKKGEIRS
jgi:hypothetical protein